MIGPGKVLMQYFRTKRISPSKGCSCYELADEMNKFGSVRVKKNIDYWTDKMMKSIKDWKKFSDKIWRRFVCPPRFVVKNLILWACEESDRINKEN